MLSRLEGCRNSGCLTAKINVTTNRAMKTPALRQRFRMDLSRMGHDVGWPRMGHDRKIRVTPLPSIITYERGKVNAVPPWSIAVSGVYGLGRRYYSCQY